MTTAPDRNGGSDDDEWPEQPLDLDPLTGEVSR
jgi:hypothetical protein